jgi:hypothetical protein
VTSTRGSDPEERRRRTLLFIAELQRNAPSTLQRLRTPEICAEIADRTLSELYPHLTSEERERKRAELMQGTAVAPPALTPDEDPEFYGLIMDVAAKVEAAALEAGFISSKFLDESRPYFATLDTGVINAVTRVVPSTRDHVVFFETQLFMFCHLMSKAVCRAMPEGETFIKGQSTTEAIFETLQRDESLVNRFREAVLAYALTGRCSNAAIYSTPGEAQGLMAAMLTDSMLRFVMAHEYGHVLCGHLTELLSGRADQVEDKIVPYSWMPETFADILAVRLLFDDIEGTAEGEIGFRYWGAEFFLGLADIMDRAVSLLSTGTDTLVKIGSHPPTHYRLEIIRRVLLSMVGPERSVEWLVLCDTLRELVSFLWTETRSVLLTLHQQGERPWGGWALSATAST